MLQKNIFSQFRKLNLPCFHALFFISLAVTILFVSTAYVYSMEVTFVWSQNTESDFAGYKIYTGPSSRNYDSVIDTGNQTSYKFQNLEEGQTVYIAVTAYDISNNESGYSSEVTYTVPILETRTVGDIDGDGQDDVIIDYGTGDGIRIRMNNDTEVELHPLLPEAVTIGDMDGNGQDDVIVDFGVPYGVSVLMNNNTWRTLHSISPKIITTGDMDGNGLDEVIMDFGGPWGIHVLMNNSSWVKLHSLSPEAITTGDMDGNGQDEVIIDFGNPYGIHILMNNSTWKAY